MGTDGSNYDKRLTRLIQNTPHVVIFLPYAVPFVGPTHLV